MPIDYYIDHARRLVVARGRGVFTDADIFGYQRDVWTQPDVAGYDELVDMTAVDDIVTANPAGPRIQQLAGEAAAQDLPTHTSKFAIVAPSHLAYGLAREFKTYRDLDPRSNKEIGIFRSMPAALAFLGIDGLDEPRSLKRTT
jgi:hypothetical protein